MTKEEVKELLQRYADGKCSPQEKAMVEHWYLSESFKQSSDFDTNDIQELKFEIWDKITQDRSFKSNSKIKSILLWTASVAAVLIFVFSLSEPFIFNSADKLLAKKEKPAVFDKSPARNKAVLTLSDGSKIILDDARSGYIADQQGIKISKSPDGSIIYSMPESLLGNNNESDVVPYNFITTPKGGKFQIILPDKSKIWLNSESTLRFPARFIGQERNVELTGEAYFEVAKNINMPFIVKTKDMSVFVTGTEFNIMAYSEDKFTSTTLVQGSVQVSSPSQKIILKPGEQVVGNQTIGLSKRDADIEETIAWKNGLFQFNNTDIATVMNQISRWYDVTVEYEGDSSGKRFGGYISRDSKLSQVLKMLELSGVKCRIEEKKIIVLP
ncbi:FecR family protein [Daejeonella sp. H1SJ63]|jgi:hypothetical protein|uniref:FecR family protein n=1 Tax=Daejeonella sp. H1SJ63 TaxID=3034145 RepID=UPI0023EADD57|nr:FecR family protein [Daejeonella sp. H1SJ63]